MWINPETMALADEPTEGYVRVMETQQPVTARLEKATAGAPALVAGVWRQTWLVEPLTAGETAQVVEAERVNAGNSLATITKRNNVAYEAAIASLTAGYPPSEIATWEIQRQEAAAWSADNTSPTPWIDAAASARGLDRVEFLNRTHTKAQQFGAASAWFTGRRQLIEDQIGVTPADQLHTIVIDYTLPVA